MEDGPRPRRLALFGLVAGPLLVIRSTLVLFDVVDPGSALDVVVVPEIIWEAGLGFYPLIKRFRTPPAPNASGLHVTPKGTGAVAATTG